MSTERNELADIFTGHPVSFGAYPKRLMRGHAQEIAEKVLAAGYRKPQQVTKLHELSTVPNGSVLRDSLGQVWHKRAHSKYESTDGLTCLEPTLLPATVLHVGGAE